jgi:lysyl-tRNA synthetase class 1
MFWADRIVKEIEETGAAKKATKEKPLIIRDEKTLSGRVHIGSMRGVAIHGLISEVLTEKGIPNIFKYELNDFDVFDTVPHYLPQEKFTPYLGMMLCDVPSPEEGFKNYAEFYGAEFESVHKKAGFSPEYYRSTELYRSGKMDDYIRIALNHADSIRRIYKEVSGSVKNEKWLPISVICENCKKVMTVRVSDWDGQTVAYACDIGPDGSQPCGHSGRVSPFGGNAKLAWKVEWAAKWLAIGVDVEGGGKDHSTKGGARDVANHIAREVFGFESPFDVPYEFFLVGGKKMSSSKGKGSSAKEMSELFPAEVFRLVLIGKDINQQIDVDPEGDSVPRTFDWFDDLGERLRAEEIENDDFARLFELCALPAKRVPLENPWELRFSLVSTIVQMPHLSLLDEAAKVKEGTLTEAEADALFERADYAKFWLATYAPEQYRYVLQDIMPEVSLSDAQKRALATLALYLETEHSGEEIHSRLHELKTEIPIQPKELFSALYKIFLARDSGPKAGWFLSVLPREFVVQRLLEASK